MDKTITFNIPNGYVIDKEKSTDTNIVLRLAESSRVRTWEEYCEKMKSKSSYYMDLSSGITPSKFGNCPFLSEFETEKEVKTFEAYSKLLKLRKDWIGEWKPDWTDMNQLKYTIVNQGNKVVVCINDRSCRSIAFPTKEMRDEFFECFKDLLEQAKTLI